MLHDWSPKDICTVCGTRRVERTFLHSIKRFLTLEVRDAHFTVGVPPTAMVIDSHEVGQEPQRETSFLRDMMLSLRWRLGKEMFQQETLISKELLNEAQMSPMANMQLHMATDSMVNSMMDVMQTWIAIAKDELTFKDILNIRNIEQRRVALKRYGLERVLTESEAVRVDKSDRGNELYKIPRARGLFDTDAYFLKYACPSTGRIYISGVPPELGARYDADEAMSWKFGWSKSQYQSLIAEA